jgi:hypothetical protein
MVSKSEIMSAWASLQISELQTNVGDHNTIFYYLFRRWGDHQTTFLGPNQFVDLRTLFNDFFLVADAMLSPTLNITHTLDPALICVILFL